MFENTFERYVHHNPRKIALVYQNETLDYKTLLERSDRISLRLRQEGIIPGNIVPIVLPRGFDAICGILGVLRAGAAFCFVDEAYPKARIDQIISSTGAKMVLNSEWLAIPFAEDAPVSVKPASPSDPAMVVYTSGSTGIPKGVVISRRAFTMALNMTGQYRTAQDVYLSMASFSFVAFVCDTLSALYMGATLHIASDMVRKDVMLLAAYIREQRITTALLPPQLLTQYLKIADGTLRVVMTGSEKVQGLFSSKTLIVNQYGASETCGPMFSFPIDKPYDTIPIASYFYESGYVLLDEKDRPVPQGETGEI